MGRVLVLVGVVVIVVAAAAFAVIQLTRPVPPISASAVSVSVTVPGSATRLTWPAQGQAAVGVEGLGVLASHGGGTPVPLASITKLMTAYVVLHDHPLAATANGPTITITATDVTTYETEKARGDSVVAVKAGEQLTELQALQGLLIPSGDNFGDLLATWDAGSVGSFVTKMNASAKLLGLGATHYVGPSGVTPGSKGTAASQVRLAMDDMALPAFRAIVAMPQVTLPVAGVGYNVNAKLGTDGVVGVKTGWTPAAGGCFLFAATHRIGGTRRTVVGAVLGQQATVAQLSAITAAFDASMSLLTSAEHAIDRDVVIHAGETLGHLAAPWARPVDLQATRAVSYLGLPGEHVHVTVDLPSRVGAPVAAHHRLGSAVVELRDRQITVPLVTSRALPAASISWRLKHF